MTTPILEDQGVLDIGKNCFLCNQLDFLPFHCELCDHIYCSQHRSIDVHHCKRPERINEQTKYDGPSAASLFPDPAKRQKELEKKFDNIALKLAAAIAKTEKSKSTPLAKLKKFLQIQKKNQSKGSLKAIFGNSKSQSSSSPLVQLAALKKVAKGPSNIQLADRIYIWALYIDRNEDDLGSISVETEKRGLWLLRNWSVGRSLDLIASLLKIMNYNNSTQHTNERLTLFRVQNDEPVLLELSKKNLGSFTNGDTLYLVKG